MTAKAWNCAWPIERMFTFTRPSQERIDALIQASRGLVPPTPRILFADGSQSEREHAAGFDHDVSSSRLGSGDAVFAAAKAAFTRWVQFNLGWARVANPSASIAAAAVVAVEVHSLGLWSVNLSRIVDVIDRPHRFGFVYSTTGFHVEQGEERFLLTMNSRTGEVRYGLEAYSRPRSFFARFGYPVTRSFQHRFARDSHARMLNEMTQLSMSSSKLVP